MAMGQREKTIQGACLENHEGQIRNPYAEMVNPRLPGSEDLWKYKTGLRRFVAMILDGIFLQVIAAPFALIIWLLDAPVDGDDVDFIIGTIYVIGLTAIYGKTPGKHLCKLKVVTYPDEGKIGIRHSALREIFPLIMVVLFLPMDYFWEMTRGPNPIGIAWGAMLFLGGIGWPILEIVTFLLDPKRRALHDKLAGTVVVKTGRIEYWDKMRDSNKNGAGD
jgi:uncharacterized RDD family membrane protein YckC